MTSVVEYFTPTEPRYEEVTLLDCNDSFTHNLVQAFLKLGAPVRVFRSHYVTVKQVQEQLGSYLVFSPGPGTPDEGGIVKELFAAVQNTIPVLGVCLGMQAINEVLGGKTVPSPAPVHGKTSNIEHDGTGIFTDITSPTTVARYHSLMIDPVPAIDIQSDHNGVVMACRLEPLSAAVQFHPESFLTTAGQQMLTNFLEGMI